MWKFIAMKKSIIVSITIMVVTMAILAFNTDKKQSNKEVCEMIVDTVAQVILFKDTKGALYVTTKYRKGAYQDMCEPLMIIKGEAERMCQTRHKVPPNSIPKKAIYSGNINGMVYKTDILYE